MTSAFVKTGGRGRGGKGTNHNFSSALKGRIVGKINKREKATCFVTALIQSK